MRLPKHFAPMLPIISAVIFLFVGCNVEHSKDKEKKDQTQKKEEAVPIRIAKMTRGNIEALIQSSANLEAEAEVKVYSRTTNLVQQLLVEEGDRVKKDQVLLRLEDTTQKIQLDKAKAALTKSRVDYARTEDLYKKELITLQEYNNASFDLKQAELDLRTAEEELNYTVIKAPISGTITMRLVMLGDQVNVNQHLFDIVDFASLIARVYLPEKNLAGLRIGQPARVKVQALGNRVFKGSILRIAPTVDAGTGTVKVTVAVSETESLRPGMFVEVNLVLDTHEQVVLIPKRALIYDSDQVFVYRVKPSNGGETRVERILLEPVLMDKDNVEPGPQIAEGDLIVIEGQTGLKDNALVKLLEEPTDEKVENLAATEVATQ